MISPTLPLPLIRFRPCAIAGDSIYEGWNERGMKWRRWKSCSHQFGRRMCSVCVRVCVCVYGCLFGLRCFQQIKCSCRAERMCFMCNKKHLSSFKFWFFFHAFTFSLATRRKWVFCCVTKSASMEVMGEANVRSEEKQKRKSEQKEYLFPRMRTT